MLTVEKLPNEITDFEKELFEKFSRDLSFMGNVYAQNQQPFTLEEYHPDTDTFSGKTEIFTMSGGFEEVPAHDIPRSLEYILPSDFHLFAAYKTELVIAPIFVEGKLNTEDTMVDYLVSSSFDSEEQAESSMSGLEYLIYEPLTKTYIYYNPSKEHPYTSSVTTVEFDCDSLDFALKASFEWALSECDYKSPDLRKKIDFMDEWFESEEGKQSIQDFIDEIEDTSKSNEEFYNSAEFLLLSEQTIPNYLKATNNEGLYSEDYMYNPNGEHLIDEETFYKFVKATFQENEMKVDEDEFFATEYVELKYLRVSQTHGQGTVYTITLKK